MVPQPEILSIPVMAEHKQLVEPPHIIFEGVFEARLISEMPEYLDMAARDLIRAGLAGMAEVREVLVMCLKLVHNGPALVEVPLIQNQVYVRR